MPYFCVSLNQILLLKSINTRANAALVSDKGIFPTLPINIVHLSQQQQEPFLTSLLMMQLRFEINQLPTCNNNKILLLSIPLTLKRQACVSHISLIFVKTQGTICSCCHLFLTVFLFVLKIENIDSKGSYVPKDLWGWNNGR